MLGGHWGDARLIPGPVGRVLAFSPPKSDECIKEIDPYRVDTAYVCGIHPKRGVVRHTFITLLKGGMPGFGPQSQVSTRYPPSICPSPRFEHSTLQKVMNV